jgi:antitoxin ParD1/3/4|nr:type II toxin-antitoxin system ParD family antitoxin [uncultured Azospirillum sp.]
MATNVHLTPELERFARDCVEGGRYNNVSEVVRSGLRLLQEAEERRQSFNAMLLQAEAEADRDGSIAIDDVLAEADAIIDSGINFGIHSRDQ